MGNALSSTGEPDPAIAEFEGLIRDEPAVETAWQLAGRALLSANQTARARPYLERAYALKPTSFTAYTLGVIAMQEKKAPRAIDFLENALQLSPDMPSALYQLSPRIRGNA